MATTTAKAPLLEILPGGPDPEDVKERILGYGRAGVGKTRWALSLPERYGKIAYFASDKNSHLLASISRVKRERVVVVRPLGSDPTANFMAFCMRDWRKVDPAINTLVVDTFSKVGMDSISFSANSGSMDREKHFVIGIPGEGGQAIPNRGDYQAVDSLGKGFLDMLFDRQADMHIIFLCHEDVKIVDGIHATGGPAYPGRQMMEYLPGQFSTCIRFVREQMLVKGAELPEDVVVAIGENDGKFIAKVRTEDEIGPNKLARVVCNRDPINWWNQYDASLNLKEAV
jgi:hypothetical protein